MKKIILYCIMVILICGFATAICDVNCTSDLTNKTVAYYDFQTLSGSDLRDTTNAGHDGSIDGATATSSNCLFGGCYYFTTNDRINTSIIPHDFKALSCWTNSSSSSNQAMIGFNKSDIVGWWFGSFSADFAGETWSILGPWDSIRKATFTTTAFNNDWKHVVMNWNVSTSEYDMFINATKLSTAGHPVNGDAVLQTNAMLDFGTIKDGFNFMTGAFDECALFNDSLTFDQIIFLYNNTDVGSDQQFPFGPDELIIVLDYPTNETSYNIGTPDPTISYTGEINLTTNINSSCVLNDTRFTITLTNDTSHRFINNTILSDGNYSIIYECKSATKNLSADFWIIIDTVTPIAITNIVNNTEYISPFFINVSYFDIFLFRTNTTLTYTPTGTIYYNNFSGDLSGADIFFNISTLINTTNGTFPVGDYTLLFEATDTHTDNNYFKNVKVKRKIKMLKNGYKNKNSKQKENEFIFKKHSIKIITPDNVNLNYIQKKDRLLFEYETSNRGETYKIISGEKSIIYLKNSPYNYHFIIDDNLWYDCEGLDVTRIVKIDKKTYKIYYIQSEQVEESHSLGGLNEFNETFNIRILFSQSGNITIGTVFDPPFANFLYNITTEFEADLAYVNETCLIIINSTNSGEYCYNLNSLELDDIIVFYSATPVSCLANITNFIGEVIDTGFNWFNRTNITIRTGTTTCEHNELCSVDTLPAYLTLFNDTISCNINITQSFFTFISNESNKLNTTSIGVCDGVNNYTILNITFRDEIDNGLLNITNGFDLRFSDGLGLFNLTSNLSGFSNNTFCTDLNPADNSFNLNMFGNFQISNPGYATRIINLVEAGGIIVSNKPYTNQTFFLITIANSSTITYTWLTTEYASIDGTMVIKKCNDDGTKSLIESTQIANGIATSNLQLFTTAYSYEVIIDNQTFIDDSFTTCHVESKTERQYFVDVLSINTLPVIGLFFVTCALEEIADNVVKMTWSANAHDTSAIEGCIVAHRQTIAGLDTFFENCTNGSTGSFTRTIPDDGNNYFVSGTISQNGVTGQCGNSVSFFAASDSATSIGLIGLIGVVVLIMALGLAYAGQGELQLAAAGLGVLVSFGLGVLAFPWEVVSMIISFLIIIAIIGRHTRKRQVS